MRLTKRATVVLTGACAAVLFATVRVNSAYRLLYNPSESAPRGWYAVVPMHEPIVDELVIAELPNEAQALAARRGYLPKDIPVLKRVAAIGGHHVCLSNGALTIDGHAAAKTHNRDAAGRVLTPWLGCRMLTADEVLILSTVSDASFDSRYFGPVHRTALLGRAIPLLTW